MTIRVPLSKLAQTVSVVLLTALPVPAAASAEGLFGGAGSELTRTVLVLTLLAIIPAIFICTTSFLRIIVVLSMMRHAFGMPQTPPNSVLTSLALFLTFFAMGPTFTSLNESALDPLIAGTINIDGVMERGAAPLKNFMLRNTREADIETVYTISRSEVPEAAADVELMKLIPAFMLNELRVAFTIGFVILLPFLMIDLVVAAILLSLGMMMVPPTTISLPIKILMFVLIDGWSLIIEGLLGGFR